MTSSGVIGEPLFVYCRGEVFLLFCYWMKGKRAQRAVVVPGPRRSPVDVVVAGWAGRMSKGTEREDRPILRVKMCEASRDCTD